jgi:hypothetical protein
MMSSALALAFLFPYPLPYPLFTTNPENSARVVPTSTIAHEEGIPRKTKKEEQKENKSKMSIFASQPLSIFGAPSHYITTKKQVKTPSYKSNPDSAISLPASTASGSASTRLGSTSIVSELPAKPQPVYSARASRSRSSSISSTSSAETTTSKDLEAPSYAPIKTPSPLASHPTHPPRPGTGISSSQPKRNPPPSYTASVSSSPPSTPAVEKKKAKATWRNLWIASEDAHDEEYEMRKRAEREDRERSEGEEKEKVPGEWCWGCLWVGPYEQPWVAHYIF